MLSALAARKYLAGLRDRKLLHADTLDRAIRERGLPWHPDPFGADRKVFYKSELDAWLNTPFITPQSIPHRRGPGRPRKT